MSHSELIQQISEGAFDLQDLITHPSLSPSIAHDFLCDLAEEILLKERRSGRKPDKRSVLALETKRCWIAGACSQEALEQARADAEAATELVSFDESSFTTSEGFGQLVGGIFSGFSRLMRGGFELDAIQQVANPVAGVIFSSIASHIAFHVMHDDVSVIAGEALERVAEYEFLRRAGDFIRSPGQWLRSLQHITDSGQIVRLLRDGIDEDDDPFARIRIETEQRWLNAFADKLAAVDQQRQAVVTLLSNRQDALQKRLDQMSQHMEEATFL